jgi:iron complex transport system permease protein
MSKYIPFRMKKPSISFLIDKKVVTVVTFLSLITIGAIIISVGLGDMKLSPIEVIKAIFGYGSDLHNLVIQKFRLPRILVAVLVGAALAVSGAILQGIIRNPLASPDIIGITGGASVAVVLFLNLFSDTGNNTLVISILWLPAFAFVGATIVAVLVYGLSWKNGVSPIRLVLIGIGLSAAMHAITTMLIILGPLYLATQATIWLTGSVYASTWKNVSTLFPWLLVLLPLAVVFARNLNIQELGDDIAAGVGSRVHRNRFVLLIMSTALAGGAVAFAGAISFVGLMAPHMARKLVGSSFGAMIPVSALIGGLIVLLADLVARTLFLPLDLPAGIFTAAIGAPYFIYLLYKNRNA